MFLRLHDHGVLANEIFWGLWLFPLGVLVFRSRFLPRFLGVWLIIGGFGYLATSFTGLLLPQYEDMVSNIALPGGLGEIAIMLWLLINHAGHLRLVRLASEPEPDKRKEAQQRGRWHSFTGMPLPPLFERALE